MNKIISDISDYIFISDEPEKIDAIFLPGGSHPEQHEYAAELYHKGYATSHFGIADIYCSFAKKK